MDLDGYLSSRYIETDEWLDFEQQLVPRGYRLATWGETGLHSLYSRIDPEEVYVDDTGLSTSSQYGVRQSDRSDVWLKAVLCGDTTPELRIYDFLARHRDHPFNHTLRNFDVVPVERPGVGDYAILIQPHIRDSLDALKWEDAVSYYRAALAAVEVLAFLHKAGIAHLDFAAHNLLHDKRTGGVYVIDFEGSQAIVDGTVPVIGLHSPTPGLNFDGLSDGFASDVYACAHSFKCIGRKPPNLFTDSRNLLTPVWELMLAKEPAERPSSDEALRQVQSVLSPLGIRSVMSADEFAQSSLARFELHDSGHGPSSILNSTPH